MTWQEGCRSQLESIEPEAEMGDRTFEDIADQLADELARSVGTNVPLLSDYAISRAGIYEEHP
ncbi:MAG: hypothetical protein AB1589_42655 [Cyanobacteriota bacterium]